MDMPASAMPTRPVEASGSDDEQVVTPPETQTTDAPAPGDEVAPPTDDQPADDTATEPGTSEDAETPSESDDQDEPAADDAEGDGDDPYASIALPEGGQAVDVDRQAVIAFAREHKLDAGGAQAALEFLNVQLQARHDAFVREAHGWRSTLEKQYGTGFEQAGVDAMSAADAVFGKDFTDELLRLGYDLYPPVFNGFVALAQRLAESKELVNGDPPTARKGGIDPKRDFPNSPEFHKNKS